MLKRSISQLRVDLSVLRDLLTSVSVVVDVQDRLNDSMSQVFCICIYISIKRISYTFAKITFGDVSRIILVDESDVGCAK